MTPPSYPPHPPIPAWMQTLRFLKNPFSLIADAVAACGDVFALRLLGLGEWVFLGSPSLVKEMFKAPPEVLAAGEVNGKQLGFMLGLDASFSLDGKAHLERRRRVHPHLNGARVLQHVDGMREVALRSIAGWPFEKPFSFLPLAHRLSLDVMLNALFRATPEEKRKELGDLFDAFASRGLRSPIMAMPALQIDLGRFSPWGKIERLRRAVRHAFEQEIERRLAADIPQQPDIVQHLLHEGAKETAPVPLAPAAVVDEVINLLFAGHETTGNILTWTMAAVLARPEVRSRLEDELGQVLGDAPITPAHLDQLPYLDAVIHETIRFHPIAPMAGVRLVKQPWSVGGYVLPPGTIVTQCFPAMGHRRDLFARPDCFDPEHFFGRKMTAYDWNPFGGGTRMCIGKGLAEVELKVVLATVLQTTRLELAQEDLRPVRHGFFFAPHQGLQVIRRSA